MTRQAMLELLRSGQSAAWNTFRRDHPEWLPDLRNANLSSCDLVPEGKQPFDLSCADLRGVRLPSLDRMQLGGRRVNLANAKYDRDTKYTDDSVDLEEFGAVLIVDSIAGPVEIRRPSVFISYAHSEEESVVPVEQWLSSQGLTIRRDKRDFFAGEQLDSEIARIMTNCAGVLVFWSTVAASRPWIEHERKLAAALEKDPTLGIPPAVIYVLLDQTTLPREEEKRIAVTAVNRKIEEVGTEILRSLFRRRRPIGKGSGIPDDAISMQEYEGLRKRIVKYMIALRNRMPRPSVDPTSPKDSNAWPDNLNGARTQRYIVYLRSSGCRWAIRVGAGGVALLPGCLDCEHSLAGSTFGATISSNDYVKQFQKAIAGVDFKTHPVLCVYNEGNFYNPEELPSSARRSILQTIGALSDVEAVIVESLPEHLTEEVLRETRSLLGSRVIEVGIGLESSNPTIRALCVNKSYTLTDFDRAVAKVKKYAAPLAYVLLKPAFLSEREALEDAVRTSMYAFEKGVEIVSIEPVNISNYNMSGELNRIGLYRSCWLWSIVEVVRQARAGGGIVRLGGEQFAPKYYRHPYNCARCTKQFYKAFQEYNATLDLSVLTSLDCACRSDWEKELEIVTPPLHVRIDRALIGLERFTGFAGAGEDDDGE